MPIRTDHGRSAVLRRLIAWPVASTRRLAGTAAVVVVGIVSLVMLTDDTPDAGGTHQTAAAAVTSSSRAAVRTSAVPTRWSNPATPTTSATTPAAPPLTAGSPTPTGTIPAGTVGDPVGAVRRFAELWVQKKDAAAWRAQLQPLVTDEYGHVVLPEVDPDEITATKVTGSGELTRMSGRGATVLLPLDTQRLSVRLQDVTGRGDWKVSNVTPVS